MEQQVLVDRFYPGWGCTEKRFGIFKGFGCTGWGVGLEHALQVAGVVSTGLERPHKGEKCGGELFT